MSEDKEAQAEAYVRRKPRSIIHNQSLIQILTVLGIYAAFITPIVSIWLVFSVIPYGVLVVLLGWCVSVATVIVLEARKRMMEKKVNHEQVLL